MSLFSLPYIFISSLYDRLAIVYTNTIPTVKRIMLKLIDQPVNQCSLLMSHNAITVQVRSIGMNSPELLELVENCPVGAETLIMRILYILTERGEPVT